MHLPSLSGMPRRYTFEAVTQAGWALNVAASKGDPRHAYLTRRQCELVQEVGNCGVHSEDEFVQVLDADPLCCHFRDEVVVSSHLI